MLLLTRAHSLPCMLAYMHMYIHAHRHMHAHTHTPSMHARHATPQRAHRGRECVNKPGCAQCTQCDVAAAALQPGA